MHLAISHPLIWWDTLALWPRILQEESLNTWFSITSFQITQEIFQKTYYFRTMNKIITSSINIIHNSFHKNFHFFVLCLYADIASSVHIHHHNAAKISSFFSLIRLLVGIFTRAYSCDSLVSSAFSKRIPFIRAIHLSYHHTKKVIMFISIKYQYSRFITLRYIKYAVLL